MNRVAVLSAVVLAWLTLLPNLGSISPLLAVDGFTTSFAALCAAGAVLLRRLQTLPTAGFALLCIGVFAMARLLWDDAQGLDRQALLAAVGAVGVACGLGSVLGRRLFVLEDAVSDLVRGTQADAMHFEIGQDRFVQEIRRARRHHRPLSMVALRPETPLEDEAVERLVADLHHTVLARFTDAQISMLLTSEIDASSVVSQRQDHFVLLLAESDRARAERTVDRLRRDAARRWGLPLHCGIASFPDEEMTLEGLLESAEADMRRGDGDVGGEAGAESSAGRDRSWRTG